MSFISKLVINNFTIFRVLFIKIIYHNDFSGFPLFCLFNHALENNYRMYVDYLNYRGDTYGSF